MRSSWTYERAIVVRLMETLLEDQLFCDKFCEDCDTVPYYNTDVECPAGFCPGGRKCARGSRMDDLEAALTSAIARALKH